MGSPKPIQPQSHERLTPDLYAEGILRCDRIVLSRAITLVESNLDADQALANDLVERILPYTGKAVRIGITGVPGVGKSTFIDAFGTLLSSLGKRLSVLAIDPSSHFTKGSILGDKTRMENLSRNPAAFVRPTATGAHVGGVANKTKEALLLCEAAGYDVVLVETVGVGQSEFAVRDVVDFFLLLLLGGAGDELQGIKKGIVEMADGLIITKADGDNLKRARQAKADYQHALHLLPASPSGWQPRVLLTSAREHTGMKETWQMIEEYVGIARASGFFDRTRREQDIRWLHSSLEARFRRELLQSEKMKALVAEFEDRITSRRISAGKATDLIWAAFQKT